MTRLRLRLRGPQSGNRVLLLAVILLLGVAVAGLAYDKARGDAFIEAQLGGQAQAIARSEQALGEVQRLLADAEAAIANSDHDITALQTRVSALEAEQADLQAQLAALQAQLVGAVPSGSPPHTPATPVPSRAPPSPTPCHGHHGHC